MKKLRNYFLNHQYLTLIIMSLVMGLLTIFIASSASSFLYNHFPVVRYVNDSNTFYYIGRQIAAGKTPYLEIFDHKGLYLFYYAALGNLLGGKIGFFFLQSLTMGATFFLTILSMREFKIHKFIIFSSTLLLGACYCFSMQSPGDFELQLPFITLMIYFYAKGLMREDNKSFLLGNVFAGVSAGVAINVRASDAMVPFAFVIAFLVISIKNKKIKGLFINAALCLASLILICIPPLIHSIAGGFTAEMYQSIILDNFRYVGSSSDRYDSSSLLSRLAIVGIMIVYFLFAIINRKKMVKDEFLIFMVGGGVLFVLQLIIAFYIHYLFIMFTFLFIFISRSFSLFFTEEKKWCISFKIVSLLVMLGSMVFFPTWYYSSIEKFTNKVITLIEENISLEERQSGHVLCLQTSSAIYLNSNINNGYPDFCCQYNHVNLSKYYTHEKLLDYLKSGECHYVISWENSDKDDRDIIMSWFNKEEGQTYFTKIVNDGIDIYRYTFL